MISAENIISIISVLIAIIGAGFSFYFSRNSKKYSEKSLEIMEQQCKIASNDTLNQYINEAVEAFKKGGTPYNYINSIPNLSLEEKEEIWYHCFIRCNGRPPKRKFADGPLENKPVEENRRVISPGIKQGWLDRWKDF
ncbi:MAG: hypothetical protein Q8K51_10325 [Nitrospirota bacterium]|nr:hypothetical protein [Nitrospirota bacterium]